LNTYNGNGSAASKSPGGTNGNNFGLGLIGTSQGNLVENNTIGVNVNGLLISSPRGNEISENLIVGNPPVQVSQTFGKLIGADIQDLSPAGTNTFEANRCLTYAGGTTPAPCPQVSGDEDRQAGDLDRAGHFVALAFQRVLQRMNVGWNRLASPQAR
jgi:hypothetical protein